MQQELAMSMHLVGPYMTTTKYSRKKSKNKSVSQKELKARQEHDKYLIKMGAHPNQLKDKLPTNAKGQRIGIYTIPNYKQHQGTLSCSNSVTGSTAKKHENFYTGDELAGIGMLHKSNMVPVRKDSNDAKEIARMRRG
jgi:hypothetical protein